jgi:hypothetical protein
MARELTKNLIWLLVVMLALCYGGYRIEKKRAPGQFSVGECYELEHGAWASDTVKVTNIGKYSIKLVNQKGESYRIDSGEFDRLTRVDCFDAFDNTPWKK